MTKQWNYLERMPQYCSEDVLSEEQKDLLTKSKVFCMLPWVHMHAYPDGRVYPCCFAEYENDYASLREVSMKEAWNSDRYKELRYNMLNNIKTDKTCKKCYEQEENGFFSMRNDANKTYGHNVGEVKCTEADGTLNDFKIRYWDVRFSNLCNMKCRSCGPSFSSQWYGDHVEMFGQKPTANGKELKPVEYAGKHRYDIWEQMQEHIPYLEQVYFAGGEPMIMEEHYLILEKLIELGKTDVRLMYNTNFSELQLKDKHVFDLWKHFKIVSVGASLDAEGARAELMRKGTKWSDIVANRKLMIEKVPQVDFYLASTLTAMNVFHLPDFHKHWVEKGLIRPEDLNLNISQSPSWYRIDILPHDMKLKVKEKYEKHIEWLAPLDRYSRATNGFKSAINFLMAKDNSQHIESFFKETKTIDDCRGEKLLDVFPELQELEKYRT